MSKEPKKITEAFGFVGGNMLKDLLEKEPAALTEAEMDILRARRDYLTEEQIEKYGLDESGEEEPEKVEEPEDEEDEEDDEEEGEKSREDELNEKGAGDLNKLAKELGIKIKRGTKKPKLIAEILKAEEDEDEDEEDDEE